MVLAKKQLLKLGLVSMAAITVGVAIGLALNYQTLRELRERPKPLPASPTQVEKEEEKIATFSGKIKPLGPSIYMEGTHFLEDEDGKMITLLESSEIDLSFLEGQTVEVEGKVRKAIEGEQMVLEVEKVRF